MTSARVGGSHVRLARLAVHRSGTVSSVAVDGECTRPRRWATPVSVRGGGGNSVVSARRAECPINMELGARVSDGWSPGGSAKVALHHPPQAHRGPDDR
jgi:hypothetical protein